jgi:hypothetical protein
MIMMTLLAALGCNGETNFTNNIDDVNAEQGVADMQYSHEYMIFTDLDWENGISSGQGFFITNVGDNNLSITTLDISDSGGGAFFVQDVEDLVLGAGLEREFTVVATLADAEPAVGELRVKSNWSGDRDLRIPLCAFPIGYKGDTSCAVPDTDDSDTGM